MGTLMGVDLTISTLGYALLEVVNDVGSSIKYNITYFRNDEIKGAGLGSGIVLDTMIVYPGITIGASNNPAVETSNPPWASNGINCLQADTIIAGCPNPMGNVWGEIQAAPAYEDVDGVVSSRSFSRAVDPSEFGAFTGSGSIKYYYDVTAALLALGSGGRYTQRIVTLNTQVTISTTYTYCPMSILPEGKLTFSARKTDNSNIALSWIKEKEQTGITYMPEVSANGYDFSSIGAMESQQPASAGTVVKYEFDYAVPKSAGGKLYFRLKQTDARGKVQYSAITSVTIENMQELALTIFPNPADRQINLQFNSVQKHNLQADLVNSVGQIVERNHIAPNGSQQYTLTFIKKHLPGIYFMRVTNAATRTQYTSRLMIR